MPNQLLVLQLFILSCTFCFSVPYSITYFNVRRLCLFNPPLLNCVVTALHRSESRNSIISNGGPGHSRAPGGGVSIAGMGSNRRPSTTLNSQRPAAKGPSRRGSVTYITQENNAGKGTIHEFVNLSFLFFSLCFIFCFSNLHTHSVK